MTTLVQRRPPFGSDLSEVDRETLGDRASIHQDALGDNFADQIRDIYPLADPITDQHHKDDVAWTTRSDRLPRRNDDNRVRHHDDSSESSRAGQFSTRQPDNAIRHQSDVLSKAKSRFNIFLNIPQPSYISMMFLRAVFSMFILQTIFFHVYHLKDDIQLSLRQILE